MIPWDWIAGSLTIVTIVLAQRKWVFWMNLIGLVAQGPWIALAVQTKSWGLMPLEAVIVGVYAWGLIRRQR